MNKLRTVLSATGLWLTVFTLLGPSVFAMCVGFFPPGRSIQPDDNTKTLIVHSDGVQRFFVQPAFTGNIEDFTLVLPAYSEPTAHDVSEDLFDRLEDLTNPVQDDDFTILSDGPQALEAGGDASSNDRVEVISTEDVGSYTVQILRAQDLTVLTEFLEENGYEQNEKALEALSYYINETAYFAAVKVNPSSLERSNWRLKPIELRYAIDAPRLPTAMLKAAPSTLNYTTYIIAGNPYIIPGSDLEFSKQLGTTDLLKSDGRALLTFDAAGQWLTRSRYMINPDTAEEDVVPSAMAATGANSSTANTIRANVNPPSDEENSYGLVRNNCGPLNNVWQGWWPVEPEPIPFTETIEGTEPIESDVENSIAIDEEDRPILEEEPILRQQLLTPEECEDQGSSVRLVAATNIDSSGGTPLLTYLVITAAALVAAVTVGTLWLGNFLRRRFGSIRAGINARRPHLSSGHPALLGTFSAIKIAIATPIMVYVVNAIVDNNALSGWEEALPFIPIGLWLVLLGVLLFSTTTYIGIKRDKKTATVYVLVTIALSALLLIAFYAIKDGLL